MKTLSGVIQNKILLAILAGVVSIGSFQVWQYNQKKHEKFIASQENECSVYIEMAQGFVNRSRILRNLKYNNIVTPGIKQPGVNTEFEKDDTYVLIPQSNTSTLPANTNVYDSILFKDLLKKKSNPEALLVKAISLDKQKKQAMVSSSCTPKPFAVSSENLYEQYQTLIDSSGNSIPDISF